MFDDKNFNVPTYENNVVLGDIKEVFNIIVQVDFQDDGNIVKVEDYYKILEDLKISSEKVAVVVNNIIEVIRDIYVGYDNHVHVVEDFSI